MLGWVIVGVVALVAAVVVFLFMGEPPQRVAIADLDDPASPMIGESVTVEGEVEASLGEQAVTVSDGESDEPLLVIVHAGTIVDGVATADEIDVVGNQLDSSGTIGQADSVDTVAPAPIAATLPSSGPIRASGTVDTFDVAAAGDILGTTLSEDVFASFDGHPYLLADEIETSFDPSTVPPDESPAAAAAS